MRDSLGLVDKNAQQTAAAAAEHLNVDNFDAGAGSDTFRDLLYLFHHCAAIRHLQVTQEQ